MVFQPKLIPRCAFIPPSVCQISRQSDKAFAFYSSFCKCAKRGRKIRRKKTKKLSQFLKLHISGTPEAILLKFGIRSTEVGGSVHSKIVLFHRSNTELRRCENCIFFYSCQYTHGVARLLLGPHDTLPCVLIKFVHLLVKYLKYIYFIFSSSCSKEKKIG